MTARLLPSHPAVTLGILAGGEGSRLGGRDKAWLEREGEALVLALARSLSPQVDAVLVSANRNPEQYLAHGLRAIHDRMPGIGPLGGLDALAAACRSEWLLTVPVDLLHVPADLVGRLAGPSGGVWAVDDEGPQPLVALWSTAALRTAAGAAIASGEYAVHALQARLGMRATRFEGHRFGNLNTPDDLVAAGITA